MGATRVRIAALVAGVICSACAKRTALSASPDAAPPNGAPRASTAEKERADVPVVAPVSRDGVRYEAVVWGRTRGLPQNGGYIAAIDEKSGAERWLVKVYDPPLDDGKERDKRDVFITSLAFGPDPRYLIVTNERNAVFRVDVLTRAISASR